jgi:hypothetical protein
LRRFHPESGTLRQRLKSPLHPKKVNFGGKLKILWRMHTPALMLKQRIAKPASLEQAYRNTGSDVKIGRAFFFNQEWLGEKAVGIFDVGEHGYRECLLLCKSGAAITSLHAQRVEAWQRTPYPQRSAHNSEFDTRAALSHFELEPLRAPMEAHILYFIPVLDDYRVVP